MNKFLAIATSMMLLTIARSYALDTSIDNLAKLSAAQSIAGVDVKADAQADVKADKKESAAEVKSDTQAQTPVANVQVDTKTEAQKDEPEPKK